MRAVIIGATGGMGRAFVNQLAAQPATEQVFALSRTGKIDPHPKVLGGKLDLTDEASIQASAAFIAQTGPPDMVILAAGLLSDEAGLKPEKSFKQQSLSAFERVFAINTFGPALVAKHFLPLMPRSGRAVFAALSARVGSISDNRMGGWYAYRASKAALNMLIRNYAIEQSRRNPDFIALSLHPGTVDTALSKPFQSGVPGHQLFTAAQAAVYLLRVIDRASPEDSGKAFDWAGAEIPA